MTREEFWQVIEEASKVGKGDEDATCAALEGLLLKRPPEGVVGFDMQLRQRLAEAMTWDVWGALMVMQGDVGEEDIEGFVLWLVSRGRVAFEGVLADADGALSAMAIEDPFECDCSSLIYVAIEVYEELTDQELPEVPVKMPTSPRGRPVDGEDERAMAARFPRLWGQFVQERGS